MSLETTLKAFTTPDVTLGTSALVKAQTLARIETRQALIAQLANDRRSAQRLLAAQVLVVLGMLVVVVALAMVKAAAVPVAFVPLAAVAYRLERTWRELHYTTLALQLALLNEDEERA